MRGLPCQRVPHHSVAGQASGSVLRERHGRNPLDHRHHSRPGSPEAFLKILSQHSRDPVHFQLGITIVQNPDGAAGICRRGHLHEQRVEERVVILRQTYPVGIRGDVVIVVAKGICRAFDHLVAFLHGQKHGIHIHVHRAVLKVGKIALVGREPQLQISNLNAFRRIYEPDRGKDQENGKKKQKYFILLHNDYL